VPGRRPLRHGRGGFELRLDDAERDMLRHLLDEQRQLLNAESSASDPAVARLFPPAYPDDLLQNLDYERAAGAGLLADRIAGLQDAEAAIDAPHPGEEQLLALLRSLNDLRLVWGVRLDISEDTDEADFPDAQDRNTYHLYLWLSWLVQSLVEGMS
jgi:Domain of unknown function (DUF2017)